MGCKVTTKGGKTGLCRKPWNDMDACDSDAVGYQEVCLMMPSLKDPGMVWILMTVILWTCEGYILLQALG